MQKLAQMIRNLVEYVKSLFRVGISMESVKAPSDGESKRLAELAVPCASDTCKNDPALLPQEPQKPLKRPKYYAPNAKLTYKDAEVIREAIGLKLTTPRRAAQSYGVSVNAISNLLRYKTYKAPLPRKLPPRYRMCAVCAKLIPDRIDGERIHPYVWKSTRFCGKECAVKSHSKEWTL